MSSVDEDLIDLERMIIHVQHANIDTASEESCLANVRRRCTAICDDGLNKLSKLMTATSFAIECECEHEAVLKWTKDAQDQLKALDSDGSLSTEDRYQQQEVQMFVECSLFAGHLFICMLTVL